MLIATLGVGLANLRNVYSANEAVARSYSVELALDQVLLDAVDAETGERGFIITAQESYLEPYDGARGAIESDLSHARVLEQGAVNGEKSATAIAAISRNAEALRQLLDGLLDTSQLVSGRCDWPSNRSIWQTSSAMPWKRCS